MDKNQNRIAVINQIIDEGLGTYELSNKVAIEEVLLQGFLKAQVQVVIETEEAELIDKIFTPKKKYCPEYILADEKQKKMYAICKMIHEQHQSNPAYLEGMFGMSIINALQQIFDQKSITVAS